MKKIYTEPSAELFTLRSADVINFSVDLNNEGEVEYIGYKGLTWTAND